MALDLSALRRIIADENRLLTGADIPAEYQSDVLGRVHGSAEALAFPLSTEEVSALLRYAHEHRVPITPRGKIKCHNKFLPERRTAARAPCVAGARRRSDGVY